MTIVDIFANETINVRSFFPHIDRHAPYHQTLSNVILDKDSLKTISPLQNSVYQLPCRKTYSGQYKTKNSYYNRLTTVAEKRNMKHDNAKVPFNQEEKVEDGIVTVSTERASSTTDLFLPKSLR